MTYEWLPVFPRIGCCYPCFSGWMKRHSFIELAICYMSCTPWKAILETNDCRASHNSRCELSVLHPVWLRTVSPVLALSRQRWQSPGDHAACALFTQKALEPRFTHQWEDVLLLKITFWKRSYYFFHLTPQCGVNGPVAIWKRQLFQIMCLFQ